MRTLIAVFVGLCATLPARAVCDTPPDPTILCGLGETAIVVDLQGVPGAADDGIEVFVRQVEGAPLPGVAIGDLLRFVPAAGDATFASELIAGVRLLLIPRDVGTYLLGLQVKDGRVRVGDDDSYTIELQQALALAIDDDEAACDQRATEVVEPAIFLGGCDGTSGCAATRTPMVLWALALPLAWCRCRRRRRPRR